MINHETERREQVLDKISIDGRGLNTMTGTASAASLLNPITADAAFVAGEVQRTNRAALRRSCDYVIVGAGASGSVIAGELAKSGADVLLVESGGMDDGPTITNPRPPRIKRKLLEGRCTGSEWRRGHPPPFTRIKDATTRKRP
jgi:hypothetical protein